MVVVVSTERLCLREKMDARFFRTVLYANASKTLPFPGFGFGSGAPVALNSLQRLGLLSKLALVETVALASVQVIKSDHAINE